MSRQTITIRDEDITYAETILLRTGEHFDDEARRFIKTLHTIDLQAVPGSGKTTALLAKLLILANYLPFEDGSGILVLSHTNAAIDRIAERIGPHCPRLFGYPSFVGTIQSFVDRFLAMPYYAQKYGRLPYRIDDGLYHERHFVPKEARIWLNNRSNKDAVLYKSRLLGEDKLGYALSDGGNDFPVGPATPTYQALLRMKKALRDSGALCFDDAFILGFEYLAKCQQIRDILQKRFGYAFVDEMQDMDKKQYEILENILHDKGQSRSVYQRIGDKNQAIFSYEVSLDDIWTNRGIVLPLRGSHRLPPPIAQVVTPFAIHPIQIDGRNTSNTDGTINGILPHVIVFDDDSKSHVIHRFCALISEFKIAGKIPQDHKHPFKAIAWRKGDDGRFGLKDYWSDYEAEAVKSKIDHSCLKSYLSFARHEGWQMGGLTAIHKKIMDGLLKVLRMEGVANPNRKEGYINERSLTKYLRETKAHTGLYDEFRMKLFHWSRDIYQGQADEVYPDVKGFVPELLQLFGKQLDKASHFVNDESHGVPARRANESTPAKPQDNIYRCPATGIEVHVGTVHSAKGETHTATLYLESEYQGSYESKRLSACFETRDTRFSPDPKKDVYKKQSCRMVYVGFSRPTHLLCFAIHRDRLAESVFRKNGWEVVYAFEPVNASGQ
jgi:hypothetical protein